MIRIAAALALVFSASAVPAEEPKLPVSLEVKVVPGGTSTGFRHPPRLQVRLVSEAKAAVVTEGLSVKLTKGDKKATISLSLPEVKDRNGRLVVPSADRLGIVRLEANEVATVPFQSSSSELEEAIKAAAAGRVELVIEYEVSEAWGKRFGVMNGKVRKTATLAK